MQKLLFIVGVPRSGTTWLWGLLTSHSQVISLTTEDFEQNKPSVINGKRITSETGAFVNYTDQNILEVINKKIKDFPEKLIIEKTPGHILYIHKILSLFPSAKILFIKRDPRAVISSMLNTTFYNFAENIDHAIEKFKEYSLSVLPFLKHPQIIITTYEKLHRNTSNELYRIFNSLGIETKNIDSIINENKNKSKVSQKDVFRKGKIDSYKKELVTNEIALIEKKLKNIFSAFGYKRSNIFKNFILNIIARRS